MNDSIYIDTSTVDFKHPQAGQFVRFHIIYDIDNGLRIVDWSRPTLDSVCRIALQGSGIDWEIGVHTDCRASQEYNKKLSEIRAKEIWDYFVQKGMNSVNLTYYGYGESRLLNDCACENGQGPGTGCLESEHQINRREELTIVKLLDSNKR